ncbi:MAG: nucleoside transporter C-terminal domain-containing protein [Verrucomicrobiota bacterium]
MPPCSLSFIAFVAMFDAILGKIVPDLTLSKLFGWIFSPAAFLMGVEQADVSKVGTLLGTKLANNRTRGLLANERLEDHAESHDRPLRMAAFALTGFANFASVGIQLGGIGAMAPDRRPDLARLGLRALFVGFTATLLNAAITGIFI